MIHAKIENVAGRPMIEIDEAELKRLGLTFGDMVDADLSASDAVEKGKAFVERYIKTFEALAK